MKAIVLAFCFGLLSPWAYAADVADYSLIIKDAKFNPEKLEVAAGQKFRLQIHNQGSAAEEFESSDLNREKLIPAGGKITITIGPLKPGSYRFYGEFNPKTAQGVIVAK